MLFDFGNEYKTSHTRASAMTHPSKMSALRAILLLGLASLGRSSSPPCDDLVRPAEQLPPDLFSGRWAFVAAGLGNPIHELKFKSRDSASFVFVNQTSGMQLTRTVRFQGSCQYSSSDLVLQGGGLNYLVSNTTLKILRSSCADCLVIHSYRRLDDYQHVYLFSRRRQVQGEEMEEFEAQVKCFNIPVVVHSDPTKELCPDDI